MTGPTMTWWEQIGAVGSATATVAVAMFAIAMIFRERNRTGLREKAAVAQISAIGYLVRRQILDWIGNEPDSHDHLESWMRGSRRTQNYSLEVRSARSRLRQMMSLIGEAPADVSERVRRAYVLYLEGVRRLDDYASQSRPRGTAILDWMQIRADAHADLRDCIRTLEDGVIEIRLLNAETMVRRQREDEEPFHRLGAELQKRKWQA
jgi:hypothetical protein